MPPAGLPVASVPRRAEGTRRNAPALAPGCRGLIIELPPHEPIQQRTIGFAGEIAADVFLSALEIDVSGDEPGRLAPLHYTRVTCTIRVTGRRPAQHCCPSARDPLRC